ncbi:MAG: ABC transporter permease [Chloroflexi bacterium]|nr:ABC transporter permease [Chloroflexota bacterium]
MSFFRQSWLIAAKDLRIFARDRFALVFSVLFPVLFILLFSMIFPSRDPQAGEIKLRLYVATEEAPGGLSHQVIAGLVNSPGGHFDVIQKDYQQALAEVKERRNNGFLAFPADFTEGAITGSGASLRIVVVSTSTNTKAALEGLARSVAAQVNSTQVSVRSAVALLEKQQFAAPGAAPADLGKMQQVLAQLSPAQPRPAPQVTFVTERLGPIEEAPPTNWIMPGYLVMFVFFAAAMGAEVIVAERETQTLERLIVTGARRSSLLAGKFLFSFLRGLGQVIILWAVGIAVFKVEMGAAPLAVIIISVLTVLMASSFGIMLASFVRTRRSAGTASTTLSIALAPLGGCWWPLFITPAWMQFIARFTPHAWATTGFNKLMVFGAAFWDVLPEMLALVGFAALFAMIGIVRFRTEA